MRKGVIYLLMTIFLLFLAENKQSQDFQQDFGHQNSSRFLLSFAKKHHITHSVDKTSFQQVNNAWDSPEENPNNLDLIKLFISVSIIAGCMISYFKSYKYQRETQIFYNSSTNHFLTRRFILLHNLRI